MSALLAIIAAQLALIAVPGRHGAMALNTDDTTPIRASRDG